MIGITVKKEYWDNFKVEEDDLDFIYNLLLETEIPQTIDEILFSLISHRLKQEKLRLEQQQKNIGSIYLPKDDYQEGQTIIFPALNMKAAKVTNIRRGFNPDLDEFKVMEVSFPTGEKKYFAACLENHRLNQTEINVENKTDVDVNSVIESNGYLIKDILVAELETNPDLVRIGFTWFPKALLVDVNVGYLNLAEALIEMEGGTPLPTGKILDQIDLPTDVNKKLTEFSLNYALQDDDRFDEVGPAGEILWCLNRLEPDFVRELPRYLNYQPVEYNLESVHPHLSTFISSINDELESEISSSDTPEKIQISLIYPHIQSGTLPLTARMKNIFPTAFQSPRVRFTFVDGNSQQRFSGWVVRSYHYIGGLKEWYQKNNIIPGSLINLQKGKIPGEVIIRVEQKRSTKEWVRTALIGADGGIVFAMLKQPISTAIDERMVVYISDQDALEKVWTGNKGKKVSLEKKIKETMRDLSKLNPQGHVHVLEIYAALNISQRYPPGPILSMLLEKPWAISIGDLYFRLQESDGEENASG
jgi:hypothetical protein